MVGNITSLTGNGLKDWLIQRVSAVYFAIYSLFLLGYLLFHPQLNYMDWSSLFHSTIFKLATILAIVSISLHTWVGIWTVVTDYVKCTVLRLTIEMITLAALIGQFTWCLMIIWGQ